MHKSVTSAHAGGSTRIPTCVLTCAGSLIGLAVSATMLAASLPAAAKEKNEIAEQGLVKQLENCLSVSDDKARLQCYDAQVAALVTAQNSGDVQVLKREDITRTKRQLFGFNMPKIGLFADGADQGDSDTLETTITSVRYNPAGAITFTTPEGASWEILQAPRRLARVQAGDRVEFKRASLGSYFVRINGQIGVKGRRIQ
jgi:hypothetical protein